MNCSSTKNYLSEKARLCSENTPDCDKCPLSLSNNGHNITCTDFECEYPEETIKIVQKWSDSHKLKTYLEDFLEKFPNTKYTKLWEGTPHVCVSLLYGVNTYLGCPTDCTKCWNQPMERND